MGYINITERKRYFAQESVPGIKVQIPICNNVAYVFRYGVNIVCRMFSGKNYGPEQDIMDKAEVIMQTIVSNTMSDADFVKAVMCNCDINSMIDGVKFVFE